MNSFSKEFGIAPWWDLVLPELIKGLPAALVAIVVAVVAFRQYRVAEAKLNLDLFEQRYELFLVIWTYISQMTDREEVNRSEALKNFKNSFYKAEFLFGPDISIFMDKILMDSTALNAAVRLNALYGHMAPEFEANRATILRLEPHFIQLAGNLQKHFSKYMNFSKWQG